MQSNEHLNVVENVAPRFPDEDEFKYLKFDWFSNDPRAIEVAARLAERWRDEVTPKRRSKRDLESAFNAVLTALEVSGAYTRDRIRIPMYASIYGGKSQRSPAHTSEVLDVLMWLRNSNFLEQKDGRRVVGKRGGGDTHLPYAYGLSDKWRDEISANPISDPLHICRNPNSLYVQLRDRVQPNPKRRWVKVTIQPTPEQVRENSELISRSYAILKANDEFMRGVELKLHNNILSSAQASYTRVFNNAHYEDGGRLYCALQSLKSKERRHLTFNGEPVLEIDYTGLHPTMLYELEGLRPHPTPYQVEGFDRDKVKTAFNILINRDKKHHTRSEVGSITKHTGLNKNEAQHLRDALYELHKPIAHRFNTGFGLKLQRADSDIALNILEYFITNKRPILMIHDSALVTIEDAETLLLIMRDEYTRVVDARSAGTSTSIFNADEGRYERCNEFFSVGNGVKLLIDHLSEEQQQDVIRSLQ